MGGCAGARVCGSAVAIVPSGSLSLWFHGLRLLPKTTNKLVEVGYGDTQLERICFWRSNIINV